MWRIIDIDFTKNLSYKDWSPDGKTLKQYYKEKYGITIAEEKQPLLVSKTREGQTVHLISSLCNLTGLTDDMRNDFHAMKDLAVYTKLEADQKNKTILTHLGKLTGQAKKQDMDFNITFTTEQDQTGFILQPPEIVLGNNKKVSAAKGNFNIKQPIYDPISLNSWILLYNSKGGNDDQDAEDLVNKLYEAGKTFGIKIEFPTYVQIKSGKKEEWAKEIKKNVDKKTQLVVAFILPKDKKGVYREVKQMCCEELGIPSQVIIRSTLRKKDPMAVCSKICLQINAKLGHPVWLVSKPKEIGNDVMLVGADNSPNPKEVRGSVIGLTATLDPTFSKYYCRCFYAKKGQDIMEKRFVSQFLEDAMKAYLKWNKKYPSTIVIFRDGVSDSQMEFVQKYELPGVVEVVEKLTSSKTKFAEVIVRKRINDRIFSKQQGKLWNPPSGTVIGKNIVKANFEYLIAAQNVTQGTLTPTKYTVIFNNTKFLEDEFWILSFWQCFNYYNWPGPVRVPAPCQYAHKVCFLVAESLKNDANKNLWEQLYFL